MIRRTVAVVVVTCAVALACSSYEAAPDGAADSGAPTIDGAADIGPVVDAAVTTDADAAPVPFCDVDGGSFCEAFDQADSVTFDGTQVDDGGAIAVVQDPRVSPPNALRMQLKRPVDSGVGCEYVLRDRKGIGIPAPNGFYAEYKVRFGAAIAGRLQLGVVVRMSLAAGGFTCDYSLQVTQGGAALAEVEQGGSYRFNALSMKPANGAWQTIAFDVHGATGARKVSAWIDGKAALVDVMAINSCQTVDRIDDLSLGLICVQDDVNSDVDLAFDDVRVIAH